MSSPTTQITIIGCGVLGRGITRGLLSQSPSPYSLILTHRRADASASLRHDFPEATLVTTDNTDPVIWSSSASRHVVIIGTQPRYTAEVCTEIRAASTAASAQGSPKKQLVVVTVCPGITIAQLESWLSEGTPVVRTMPNTPITVRLGATGLFPNRYATTEVTAEVQAIFQRISPAAVIVPCEDLMDIVASASGSAPAYVFYLMQSLVAAASSRGLPTEIARELVVQSVLGSAALAQGAPDTMLLELLSNVCVEGGSTEKAIRMLDQLGTGQAVQAAVEESWKANRAMSGEAEVEAAALLVTGKQKVQNREKGDMMLAQKGDVMLAQGQT